jgi:hypothetical protein
MRKEFAFPSFGVAKKRCFEGHRWSDNQHLRLQSKEKGHSEEWPDIVSW